MKIKLIDRPRLRMLKHASTTSEMPANDNSLNFTAYTGYTRTTSDSGIHLAEATESKFRSIYIGSVQVTFIRRRTETNSRDSRAFKTRLSCLLITVACIDLREKQPRNVTVRLTSTEATIEQSKTMRFIDNKETGHSSVPSSVVRSFVAFI